MTRKSKPNKKRPRKTKVATSKYLKKQFLSKKTLAICLVVTIFMTFFRCPFYASEYEVIYGEPLPGYHYYIYFFNQPIYKIGVFENRPSSTYESMVFLVGFILNGIICLLLALIITRAYLISKLKRGK